MKLTRRGLLWTAVAFVALTVVGAVLDPGPQPGAQLAADLKETEQPAIAAAPTATPPEPESTAAAVTRTERRVDFDTLEASALRGNYQSQRNMAYLLAHPEHPLDPHNRVLGCAWRMVIVLSGSPRVDETDTGNLKNDCGRLDEASRTAAAAQADRLLGRIRGSDRS